MNDKDIRLANGELLNVNINFLTLKLINDLKIDKLENKLANAKTEEERTRISLDITGKMIYVILRSNGKRVDEEEAMMLVPMDLEDIQSLFEHFSEKMEQFKKKEELKAQEREFQKTI